MPIKFRCPHCRQLLGIARGKAGLPVDCPTCGRTVRVPHLDGRVDPLPKPGLNLLDSSLVEALDQVAMIGTVPKEDAEEVFAEFEPEPISIAAAAAAPAIPVVIEAPLPAAKAAPRAVAAATSAGAEPAAESASAFNELSRLAGPAAQAGAQAGTQADRRSSGAAGMRGWFAGLAAFGIGLTGFGVGFLVGARSSAPPAGAPGKPEADATTSKHDRAVATAAASRPAIRGRITYRTDAGDSKPDAGARVLVLPQQRQGEVKLPVTGFRAADSGADLQVALASIRALGGELAIVGDDGTFEALLPTAGAYQVVVISHFQSQPEDAPLEPAVKRLLDAWFTRPEQLTGRLRYHLGQVRYSGDAAQLFDHSFDRAT